MKRTTHLVLGAAVALPIAVSHAPLVAAGCLWWGMAGGGLPDWFDLKSELRRPLRLRHRGASHSFLFLAVASLGIWFGLNLVRQYVDVLDIDSTTVDAWSIASGLGIGSHLLSDACTFGGIRPLLPFSRFQVWLLPNMLRSRSDGYLNRLFWWGGVVVIGFELVLYAANY